MVISPTAITKMKPTKKKPRIVIDSREQCGYTEWSDAVEVSKGTLKTGDYSLDGYEYRVSVERKSVPDFIQSVIQPRFWEEMTRMSKINNRYLLIECNWIDVVYPAAFKKLVGQRQINQKSVLGFIDSLQAEYRIPVMFAGDRPAANAWVERYLVRCWKYFQENPFSEN